jgi:hypothetical protein
MDKKKIFNLKQIEGACIIGSPIVAGILIYKNYKNFGQKEKGISWIFIGILWTVAVFGLAMLIPENLVNSTRMVVPMINGLILYPIINRLQGDRIREHFENEGEKGSNWLVAGLTILVAAMIIVPIILLDKVSPINDYVRQPFDSNGIYYNYDMPIEEVNKLGGILQRIEYFNPESPSEVVFLATDSTFELKLIIDKEFYDDKDYVTEISQIFKHVGRYEFEKPLIYMFTNPYLTDNKIIRLENHDSIPMLLEAVEFEKNKNFKLIYELSIDKAERDKIQRAILSMDNLFPPQNKVDFLMDLEDETYFLRLFIPKQSWSNPQLISEARIVVDKLNNFGFDYPLKLVLVDNTTMDIEEYEIE